MNGNKGRNRVIEFRDNFFVVLPTNLFVISKLNRGAGCGGRTVTGDVNPGLKPG
jgi:hypothetical protein